ncbi:hypothetical protein J6590_077783 [Homalodisca vitripennis]|nr:hypothetical protein J6590_077783 [Homalodisca vitripennis]
MEPSTAWESTGVHLSLTVARHFDKAIHCDFFVREEVLNSDFFNLITKPYLITPVGLDISSNRDETRTVTLNKDSGDATRTITMINASFPTICDVRSVHWKKITSGYLIPRKNYLQLKRISADIFLRENPDEWKSDSCSDSDRLVTGRWSCAVNGSDSGLQMVLKSQ